MAMVVAAALTTSSLSLPVSVMCSAPTLKTTATTKKEWKRGWAVGDFGHLASVVRKDVEFLKKGFSKGIEWANEALRIPQVSKTLDDVVWLRGLEDPRAPPEPPPSWPQPYYPGQALLLLSFSMDLLLFIYFWLIGSWYW